MRSVSQKQKAYFGSPMSPCAIASRSRWKPSWCRLSAPKLKATPFALTTSRIRSASSNDVHRAFSAKTPRTPFSAAKVMTSALCMDCVVTLTMSGRSSFDHLAVVGVEVGYPVPLGEHLQAALAPSSDGHDLGLVDGIVGGEVAVRLAKRARRLFPLEQAANASRSHDGYPVF